MTTTAVKCPTCGTYTSNGPDHPCPVYDGPACQVCGAGTVYYTVGAPGIGHGTVCENGHDAPIGHHRITTLEEQR